MVEDGEDKNTPKPEGDANAADAAGNPPVVPPVKKTMVEQAREENDRAEKVRDEIRAENDRTELLKAEEALGGGSDAGQVAPEKKPETDEEFTERFEKGEVDLLAK